MVLKENLQPHVLAASIRCLPVRLFVRLFSSVFSGIPAGSSSLEHFSLGQ